MPDEPKVLQIDPVTIYLKIFHILIQKFIGMRYRHLYPPTFRNIYDTQLPTVPYDTYLVGEELASYSTKFDILDDEMILMPIMTEIRFYPNRVRHFLMHEFRLEEGEGYHIALAITVHAIIHELFHHYDNTCMWGQYQERMCDNAENAEERKAAFNSYRKFVMEGMESAEIEYIVEGRTIDVFSDIWMALGPWPTKEFAGLMCEYFEACEIYAQFSNKDCEEAKMAERAVYNLIDALHNLAKEKMPSYTFTEKEDDE